MLVRHASNAQTSGAVTRKVARPIASVLAAAMLCGCVTYSGSKTTAKVGAVMTLVGIATVAAAIALGAGNGPPQHDTPLAIGVAGVAFVGIPGVLLGAGGLIGMAVHDKPTPLSKRKGLASMRGPSSSVQPSRLRER